MHATPTAKPFGHATFIFLDEGKTGTGAKAVIVPNRSKLPVRPPLKNSLYRRSDHHSERFHM